MDERSPGVWRLRVFIGRNGAGRTIHASRTFRGGRRQTQDALRKFVAEVEQSRTPDRRATVGGLLERWLEHIRPERTALTWASYRQVVDRDLIPAFGKLRLDRLTPETLDRQYARWVAGGLSPTTVGIKHRILSAALRQGVKWGWLDVNPAARATAPRKRTVRHESLPPAELAALVAGAEERGDRLLATAIALAAVTGCRRGELCALRWSDVDLAGASVTVARALSVVDGVVIEGDTKTHQVRRLALGDLAVAVIERRQAAQAEGAARAGMALVADPWLLSRAADGGDPLRPDGLTHAFARLCRARGVNWRFHDLRHFAATTAIAAGVDVRTVAGRLGHADASVTLRVYAHALESRDRAAADVLDRALDKLD